MGLTKQYLKYKSAGNFNLIASNNCNIAFVTLEEQEGRFVAVGAYENIIIWDLRLGVKAQVLPGETSVVTAIAISPNKRNIAAGYLDGNINIYDIKSAEVINVFSGHHSEISTLTFDCYGHKLASGSKDTNVIVWDTVAESGLCRLIGHTGPVTQVLFLKQNNVLITSSKDKLIKFWDIETQHCFITITEHKSEVWGMALVKEEQYLVSGCCDSELRVWNLTNGIETGKHDTDFQLKFDDLDDLENIPLHCYKVGSLIRAGKGRICSIVSDKSGQILGCHGIDSQIELFKFCTDDEAHIRMKKRVKKESKLGDKNKEASVSVNNRLTLKDKVKRLPVIKLSEKPKSMDVILGNGGELRVTTNLTNNIVEIYTMQSHLEEVSAKCLRSIYSHGHRTDARSVRFSNDNLAIASGSAESVKLWNRASQTCLRTVTTGYVLSMVFAPGDRYLLVGQKNGCLLVIDIAAGEILEEIKAHNSELWSIDLLPDQRGCVTGGGDNTLKFWRFELISDQKSESKLKVLSLVHFKTLKLEDGVLSVRMSPNGKFIAAALLDSTVKLFFADTFKFHLSLYGHSLPVLCMDISTDSALIITGSADRNVKIWGMDFGDCHRSIFAHDDSVTSIQFVPKTHYFFTCGKDGKVKQWDGDSFDKIKTLHGHFGAAWCLSVSPNGQFLVSSGADKVLRLHEKSDEILVLQDEQEDEREQELLATGDKSLISGQQDIILPSKKTVGSEKAAESILECLEVSENYKEQLAEHTLQAASNQLLPPLQPPLLMQSLNVSTPEDFMLETLKRIRPSDLEEALLILPFASVNSVLQILPDLLQRGGDTELVCKVAIFLLKLHNPPIVSNEMLLTTLSKLQNLSFKKAKEFKDLIGFNMYAMRFLQKEIELTAGNDLFSDASIRKKKEEKKRRHMEKIKRSRMIMSS